MTLPAGETLGPFDRELGLPDLLDARKLERWAAGVCRSLGVGVAVPDASGSLHAVHLGRDGDLGEAAVASLAAASRGWCEDLDALGRAPGGSEEREEGGFFWRAATLRSGADPVGLLVLGPRLADPNPWGAAGEALARVRAGTLRALLPPLRESLEWVMRAESARKMVSALHLEAVESGYRELAEANQRLRESEGQLQFLVEDLTRGVQAAAEETLRAQGEAYLREKQASVGRLAAGIAHEINNPLAFVAGNLGAARQYLEDLGPVLDAAHAVASGQGAGACGLARLREAAEAVDLAFVLEDFRALLDEARQGADRVSRIVRDLKDFSRVDRVEDGDVDLAESLRTAARLAAGRAPAGVVLAVEVPGPVVVRGSGGALHQALWNLVENALWAAGQGGSRVRLACSGGNGEAWFEVEDDGPGVPPECLPLLFDPFYTTKEVGQGAGLGLAVVRDVAQAHGGRAEVFSEPGRGARFRVTVPAGSPP